jgi:hypothetical protein
MAPVTTLTCVRHAQMISKAAIIELAGGLSHRRSSAVLILGGAAGP